MEIISCLWFDFRNWEVLFLFYFVGEIEVKFRFKEEEMDFIFLWEEG